MPSLLRTSHQPETTKVINSREWYDEWLIGLLTPWGIVWSGCGLNTTMGLKLIYSNLSQICLECSTPLLLLETCALCADQESSRPFCCQTNKVYRSRFSESKLIENSKIRKNCDFGALVNADAFCKCLGFQTKRAYLNASIKSQIYLNPLEVLNILNACFIQ